MKYLMKLKQIQKKMKQSIKLKKVQKMKNHFFLYKYDETTEDNEIDSDTNDTDKMLVKMIQSLIKESEKISSSDDFD